MTVALILTTYNWPEALELSLNSILKQTRIPDEIIIADDGSTFETKQVIDKFKNENTSLNIKHTWQEDIGFRAAASRNLAAKEVKSEYIIYIDGDMILDENFVSDHLYFSKRNVYLQGSRVLLSEELTRQVLSKKCFDKNILLSKHIKNSLNRFRCKALAYIYSLFSKNTQKGIRSCNFSFYKEDLFKVNGFNEDFITWGREDSELITRMYNIGIKRKNVKFSAIQYHLYHKEGHSNSLNDKILEDAISKKKTWCDNGLEKQGVKNDK